MKLTIHRGTHEIGGNCVELATASARIIIDVGMPLIGDDGEPFDAKSLRGKSVQELLEQKILPNVPGLFDEAAPPPDAILLSHAHLDHSGLLQYAHPSIPVIMSKGTSKMLLAGSIFAGQARLARERTRIIEPDVPTAIGDIQVAAKPVDHSAFDSMAFLIEVEGTRLLYSGDLRLHGRKPGMAQRLLELLRDRPIDVLLMEGTHFGADRERGVTEQELEEVVMGHLTAAPGIVLATFSPMNVDRLVTFYRAARRTGRMFVVDPYAAFVMHLVSGQCKIPKPTAEAGIRVCYNRHFVDSYRRRNLAKVHDLFLADRISSEEVLGAAEKCVMTFRPSMARLDFNGHLPKATTCLYSYWDGYLERPEWIDFKKSVDQADGTFAVCHTSGHIFADDLVDFVRQIGPRVVVPMHTMEPARFREHFPNTIMLDDGVPVGLDELIGPGIAKPPR
jgi:ribonuclease J